MAEKIISPGVFTNEIDQTFLPAAVADIGAAIIGPPLKSSTFCKRTTKCMYMLNVNFITHNKCYFNKYNIYNKLEKYYGI